MRVGHNRNIYMSTPYSFLKNDKNYASMMNLGNSSLNKSNSRNNSYHNKISYSKDQQDSLIKNGHKKINSFNNFSDRETKSIIDKKFSIESLNQNVVPKTKSRRSKGKHNSGLILAMDVKSRVGKFPKQMLPVTFQNKHDDQAENSKERVSRRSKQKSKINKWKLSPYKKKLAAKIVKMKQSINETPGKTRNFIPFKKKRFSNCEYTNFMNGNDCQLVRKSQKFPTSSKRRSSRDLESKPVPANYKEMLTSSSKHKSKSKRTKSGKFTFLTINNYG